MMNSVDDLPRSDSSLIGLAWVRDGRDLQLAVALGDGRQVTIIYTWVAGLACELSYPHDAGGPLLTWDVEYTASGGRHTALWDFASQGSLRFTFQDATYTDVDG